MKKWTSHSSRVLVCWHQPRLLPAYKITCAHTGPPDFCSTDPIISLWIFPIPRSHSLPSGHFLGTQHHLSDAQAHIIPRQRWPPVPASSWSQPGLSCSLHHTAHHYILNTQVSLVPGFWCITTFVLCWLSSPCLPKSINQAAEEGGISEAAWPRPFPQQSVRSHFCSF